MSAVADLRPPAVVMRWMNPLLGQVLQTPLGGGIKALALLRFKGRRSGCEHRVPVCWHELDDVLFVLTPAPWRANFVGGAHVIVHHRGRAHSMLGTLDPDAEAAARAVRGLLASGVADRAMGLRISAGHEVTTDDMQRVNRRIIRFSERVAARPPR